MKHHQPTGEVNPSGAPGNFEANVIKLMDDLAGPAFSLRMARALMEGLERRFPKVSQLEKRPERARYVGARKRVEYAAREIDRIVMEYARKAQDELEDPWE